MPNKPEPNSRIPSAVGAIPVFGDMMRSADAQARWMQELLEQNTRLLTQLPESMKTLNDSLDRFNQTIQRLDHAVTQIDSITRRLTGPIQRLASILDPKLLRDLLHRPSPPA